MISKLVIATHNRKKAGEMVTILSKRFPQMEIATLADYDGAPEPEEIGTTYNENARIKAESAFAFTGEWCVADDAGLEIDALDGAPGLYSKRFGGEGLPFAQKMSLILDKIQRAPSRAARFRCNVALIGPGYAAKVFEATCEGVIADQPSGGGGFGYDPIFFLPDHNCTMADLTAEQKHEISHRGKVLRAVGDEIASLG
ncbi:MAG: RdgB/HAM1 family non-canonical purine NTP pyrophosphatase [Armatimonadota bacterium]